MTEQASKSTIPESFLEHRQTFAAPWAIAGRFQSIYRSLVSALRNWGVALTDFSFNKEATNVGETYSMWQYAS